MVMRRLVMSAAVATALASGCTAGVSSSARTHAASSRPVPVAARPARRAAIAQPVQAPAVRVLTLADGLGGRPPVVISVGQRLAVDLPSTMYPLQVDSTGVLALADTSGGYPPGSAALKAALLAVAPGETIVQTDSYGGCGSGPNSGECEVGEISWTVAVVVKG